MARPTLQVNSASIVLIGAFNPTIFQPEWFVRQNLLPEEEAKNAKVKAIAAQVCEFETERFIIQVTTQRFMALPKPDANPAPLRDLVGGTFFLLEHTPLTALGLNRDMHFSMTSEEEWHRVGDRLVPKEIWNKILPGRVGMKSLWIQSEVPGFPGDQQSSRLMTKVEPSELVKPLGVFIQSNEHHEAKDKDAKYFVERLRARWEGSYNYASEVANQIFSAVSA